MRWIVGSSLRFRFLVVAAAAALMFFGGARAPATRRWTSSRSSRPPRVEVQTACLGLSAAEVEELVTVPLEEALNGVPGVDVIRSKSVPQLSHDRAALQARHELPEGPPARPGAPQHGRADAADLGGAAGHDAAAVGDEPGHEDRPVVEDHRLIDLSMIAYWKIRARLLRVPGVANVAIWGERLKDMDVHVRPNRLKRRDRSRSTRSWRSRRRRSTPGSCSSPRRGDRHRRVHRHAEPAARRPRTSRRSSRRTTWPRSRSPRRNGRAAAPRRRGRGRRRYRSR